MNNYSPYVPNVHFELIPIRELISGQEYQRKLSETHVRQAAENFDTYQINPVKVSRRDGVNYVFNGQHTIEIVASVSGSRDTPVWCMVYDDMDYITEADVFANQQKFVKPLTPLEIFQANIEAGNEEQLMIKALVESYGLTLANRLSACSIRAVAALEFIYEKYGFHVLDRTLRLCFGSWEGDKYSLSAGMLKGIAKLVVTYGDFLKDDLFKEKVGSHSAREITRTAKERKGGQLGFAEALLIEYNRKLKNGLKWHLLYSNKRPEINTDIQQTEEFYEPSAGWAYGTEKTLMHE